MKFPDMPLDEALIEWSAYIKASIAAKKNLSDECMLVIARQMRMAATQLRV